MTTTTTPTTETYMSEPTMETRTGKKDFTYTVETATFTITAFGETRKVECTRWAGTGWTRWSAFSVFAARFPSGSKLWPCGLDVVTADGNPAEIERLRKCGWDIAPDGSYAYSTSTSGLLNSNRARVVGWYRTESKHNSQHNSVS